MAERFAFLYETAGALSAAQLLRMLEPAGLQLANPVNGQITRLDEEGDQVVISRAELDQQLATSADSSLQLWFAGDQDLYTRVRLTPTARVLELGMEGSSPADRARIAAVLRAHMVARPELCIGLVFDPEGATADYAWDSFFLAGADLDGRALGAYWPTALVVRRSDLKRTVNLRAAHPLAALDALLCIADDPAWQ